MTASQIQMKVYYGAEKRWDQAQLEKASRVVGHECEWFDGLEAVYFVAPEKAHETVVALNESGIAAQAQINGELVGTECPADALRKARRVMSRLYEAKFVPAKDRRN